MLHLAYISFVYWANLFLQNCYLWIKFIKVSIIYYIKLNTIFMLAYNIYLLFTDVLIKLTRKDNLQADCILTVWFKVCSWLANYSPYWLMIHLWTVMPITLLCWIWQHVRSLVLHVRSLGTCSTQLVTSHLLGLVPWPPTQVSGRHWSPEPYGLDCVNYRTMCPPWCDQCDNVFLTSDHYLFGSGLIIS